MWAELSPCPRHTASWRGCATDQSPTGGQLGCFPSSWFQTGLPGALHLVSMAVHLRDELPGGGTAESNGDLLVFPLIRTLRHQHFPHTTDPGASFLIVHHTPFYGWALLSFRPPLSNTGSSHFSFLKEKIVGSLKIASSCSFSVSQPAFLAFLSRLSLRLHSLQGPRACCFDHLREYSWPEPARFADWEAES